MGLRRNQEIKDSYQNDAECPSQILPCSKAREDVRTAVGNITGLLFP